MPAFNELTPEQQEQIHTYDRMMRANIGNFAQVLANFLVLADYWDSTVGSVIGTVTDTIPSDSGLAGIENKGAATYDAMNTAIENLLASHYAASNRQNYTELAGPGNVIGRMQINEE